MRPGPLRGAPAHAEVVRALAAGGAGAAALLLLVAPARGADRIAPGAYCPLPEKGHVAKCLAPAQETFGDFFRALEGDAPDAALADVEDAVARGAAEERAYLALSSLSYGYYRLAQRAAESPAADPVLTRRLARWNELLARAYRESPADARYRAAVRQAAEELRDRAPVALPCVDAAGEPAECTSTESVLRELDAAGSRVGIRGALERLLQRFFGEESS